MLGFGIIIPVFGFIFFPEKDGLLTSQYNADELTRLYVILVASFSLGAFFGAPFTGALSDRYGRKYMLIFTYITNLLGYMLFIYGITHAHYGYMYLARIGAGLTGGSLLIIQSSLADVSTPENKTRNFGLTGIAFGLGFIIGAFLGGVLSDPSNCSWFNLTTPFWAAALIFFINIIFLIFFFKETNHHRNDKSISVLTGPKNIIKAIKSGNLLHLFFIVFLITLSFNFFVQLFQFYIMDKFHYSRTGVGGILGIFGLLIAIAQGVILPILAKRYSTYNLLKYSLPLFALSYLIILYPTQISHLILAVFILVIMQGISFPTSLAIISNKADKSTQGEMIGINQSVQSLAAACPTLLSLFIKAEYHYPMYFGAIVTFFAWLYYLYFENKIK
jgi:DHA1 family tetracycline resistance protein-like MFS transporter